MLPLIFGASPVSHNGFPAVAEGVEGNGAQATCADQGFCHLHLLQEFFLLSWRKMGGAGFQISADAFPKPQAALQDDMAAGKATAHQQESQESCNKEDAAEIHGATLHVPQSRRKIYSPSALGRWPWLPPLL